MDGSVCQYHKAGSPSHLVSIAGQSFPFFRHKCSSGFTILSHIEKVTSEPISLSARSAAEHLRELLTLRGGAGWSALTSYGSASGV